MPRTKGAKDKKPRKGNKLSVKRTNSKVSGVMVKRSKSA